jgi:NADPH-dependent glutamate synthase beta subunit-like oxidoreductase
MQVAFASGRTLRCALFYPSSRRSFSTFRIRASSIYLVGSPPRNSYLQKQYQQQQPKRYFSSPCYKIAIVGSGPAGCYTAKYLQSSLDKLGFQEDHHIINVIERLPVPFGLVRFGVAPDHPEVKNVEKDFVKLFETPSSKIQFFGNVTVGRDISVQELRETHDVVVLAYGCESNRKLGIAGEDDLTGVLCAREFVAWYNGKRARDYG